MGNNNSTSSRSWWWTGRPSMLWSIGSQRAGHNWAELNGTEFMGCWSNWIIQADSVLSTVGISKSSVSSNHCYYKGKYYILVFFKQWFVKKKITCLFIHLFWIFFFGCSTWHVGFYFPSQGLNLYPLAVGAQSLNCWTSREVPTCMCLKKKNSGEPHF